MNTTQFKDKIREHMPIVCSENEAFGNVDRIEGDQIKVTKDQNGQHHYFPLDWVTRVDDKVHVDRPGREVMKRWSTTPPTGVAPR